MREDGEAGVEQRQSSLKKTRRASPRHFDLAARVSFVCPSGLSSAPDQRLLRYIHETKSNAVQCKHICVVHIVIVI